MTPELEAKITAASRSVEDARRVVFHHPGKLGMLVEQISVLAELRAKHGDLRKAESLYREAMFRVRELKVPDLTLESGILSLLAYLYDGQGMKPECIDHYEQALQVGLKAAPPDYGQIGTVQNNLAMALKDEGQTERAAELYEQALKSFRLADGNESLRVATVLNNLGVLHYTQMRITEALDCHSKAHQIRVSAIGFGGDESDLAQTYRNLSAVHKALGDFREAETCLVEARRLTRETPPTALKPKRSAALVLDRAS